MAEFVKDLRAHRTAAALEQPLGETLIRSIMTQLFEAIEYLHNRKVCHRDLKPDNILVAEGGLVTSEDGLLSQQKETVAI